MNGQPSGSIPMSDRSQLASVQNLSRAALCILSLGFLALPCHAQKGGSGGGGGGGNRGSSGGGISTVPNYPSVYSNPYPQPMPQPYPDLPNPPKPAVFQEERCLPWNASEDRDVAISLTRLQIPSKAKSEYEKACDANNKKKFDEAEQHVRSAIEKFQSYAAAYVMLGVVLEEKKKDQDARDACDHAMTIDAKYLPAYLCKAEFSSRGQDWDAVLNLASMAIGLNSMGNGYVYYYRALALFHMNNLDDAKKSALQAAEIDVSHSQVPLYFLLAQIYEAQGARAEAVAEMRKLLKHHTDKQQEDAAKQYLAQLESQQDAK
jgi:predicted Zn-dependent protease